MQDTTKGIDTGRGRKTLLREKKKKKAKKRTRRTRIQRSADFAYSNNPFALCVQVLKGRYFPNESFSRGKERS